MRINIGDGSIVVEHPSGEIRDALVRFRHRNDGSGEFVKSSMAA